VKHPVPDMASQYPSCQAVSLFIIRMRHRPIIQIHSHDKLSRMSHEVSCQESSSTLDCCLPLNKEASRLELLDLPLKLFPALSKVEKEVAKGSKPVTSLNRFITVMVMLKSLL
jgi:hypothetical protein